MINSTNREADSRVALVTGSGRGIGRAIALALASRGWSVALNYQGDAISAGKTLQEVKQFGQPALLIQANIARPQDRFRLIQEIKQAFGQLNLLVNNAGIAPRQRTDLLSTSEASYDEVMETNLKGPFFLTQHIANWMIELIHQRIIQSPKIINIGSISAYTSSPNRAEYCLSKAGIGMMTALFADRLAEYGIGVYEIRPGIIATDMTSTVKDKYDQLFEENLTPIRRWGQPEDVAAAVIAVAEGYFSYSTGEVINVDGGFHLRRL